MKLSLLANVLACHEPSALRHIATSSEPPIETAHPAGFLAKEPVPSLAETGNRKNRFLLREGTRVLFTCNQDKSSNAIMWSKTCIRLYGEVTSSCRKLMTYADWYVEEACKLNVHVLFAEYNFGCFGIPTCLGDMSFV